MKRVLIAGTAGYFGRHSVPEFVAKEVDAIITFSPFRMLFVCVAGIRSDFRAILTASSPSETLERCGAERC